ncbi:MULTISPECIES: hypothetical protein [unclassified Mesorhizobium]|uniref:hypothetical protein n=1 Tax=unclassified Mesorhizobium TaxID=325217 RepID=UPI000BDA185C|nr:MULTISPECIES: hypothetical protein [unclassified Mesorhizobium]PBB39578.1 hypothetical protein CK221_01790 [Mesorhizobium sp. WSM3868]TGQ19365.1 hypothetical protein EN860_019760 [Mesorhizobium sp. M00.F.Ca.ET.217.01.1.1]TGV89068.1 hypothetical protein EN801_021295 [Mesorhizobium sp. M00.F.Ca.ET.158.01.1.1]
MSNAKLHIDIAQGTIEAEGSEDFVWKVYEDFRDNLQPNMVSKDRPDNQTQAGDQETPPPVSSGGRKPRPKRVTNNKVAKESTPGLRSYRPKLVDDLDTRGIKEFIAPYAMTNHYNNIVAFVKFLESKGRKPATFDQVFTCYRDAGIKLPVAFPQAFIDARRNKGFIEFTGSEDVDLTIRGTNHIDHGGMNKPAQA